MSKDKDKDSICLDCIYGSQPYNYYPIVCVYNVKRFKEMWYDKRTCKHFERVPEPPKPLPQIPWVLTINYEYEEMTEEELKEWEQDLAVARRLLKKFPTASIRNIVQQIEGILKTQK